MVFPSDALGMQSFILIRIGQPKMRVRAAKHHATKLEPENLVEIATLRERKDLALYEPAVLGRFGLATSDDGGQTLWSYLPLVT